MSLSNIDNVPLQEVAAEEARLALQPYNARRDALLKSLENVTVADDEDIRRTSDKIAMARALREAADGAIEPVQGPYRDGSTAVRNVAANFCGTLKGAEQRAQAAIDDCRARQREAAAKARNEQRAREAELRARAGLDVPAASVAPVRAADVQLENIRSDLGSQVFDRKVDHVSIVDPRALPDTILKSPGVTEALERAVRQMAKLTKDIPGALITTDKASSIKAG